MKPAPSLSDLDPETGRLAACFGKERFTDPAVAHRVASRSKYGSAVPYRCPHCHGLHIGRPPGHGIKHKRKGKRK